MEKILGKKSKLKKLYSDKLRSAPSNVYAPGCGHECTNKLVAMDDQINQFWWIRVKDMLVYEEKKDTGFIKENWH